MTTMYKSKSYFFNVFLGKSPTPLSVFFVDSFFVDFVRLSAHPFCVDHNFFKSRHIETVGNTFLRHFFIFFSLVDVRKKYFFSLSDFSLRLYVFFHREKSLKKYNFYKKNENFGKKNIKKKLKKKVEIGTIFFLRVLSVKPVLSKSVSKY